MPIRHLIASGIGFNPGSVKYVVTRGLDIGPEITRSAPKGGYWPSRLVKPQKRHKKLETFREELERLVARTERVTERITEEELEAPKKEEAEKVIDQTSALVERFNIVQSFDNSDIIASQMELIRQDLTNLLPLLRGLEGKQSGTISLYDEQEIILLLLASEP